MIKSLNVSISVWHHDNNLAIELHTCDSNPTSNNLKIPSDYTKKIRIEDKEIILNIYILVSINFEVLVVNQKTIFQPT